MSGWIVIVGCIALVLPVLTAWAYEAPTSLQELERMMPAELWDRAHVDWVNDVVVVLQPYAYSPSAREKLVREFDPDLMDWYCGLGMNRGRFMWMRGVRCSAPEEYEYQEALQFANDVTERLFMDNGITRKLDGTPARFGPKRYHNAYFMCHNAPKWHEMVIQGLTRMAAYGDSVTQDNIGVPLNKGGGNFCNWCNRAFVKWLRRRYPARTLQSWGLQQPDQFDIREYINARRAEGMSNERLIELPLIREYIRFQYMSHIAAWVDAATATKLEARQQGLPIPALYGNQWGAWGHLPYATALSHYVDVVWIEGGYTQPPFSGDQHALAPLFYKVGRAAGDFRRPVWTIEYPEHKYPTSKMATAAALSDAFASGGFLVGLWAMRELEGPRYEVNKLYWQFAAANRGLFSHRQQVADVALVYSLPTWMWRRFSSLTCGVPQGDYALLARIFEDGHIPFECLVFGHPDIYDDSAQLARMKRYRVVVVYGADCVSDRQLEALRQYVEGGGCLVVVPPFAERDEDLHRVASRSKQPPLPRPSAEELSRRRVIQQRMGKGRLVWLSDDFMADWKAGGERKERAFVECVSLLGRLIGEDIALRTDAPRLVWTELWESELAPLWAVHLVNYDLDLKADIARKPAPFKLSVRESDGFAIQESWLLRPGKEPVELSVRRVDGRAEVTVPEMEQYAIVTFGPRQALEATNAVARLRRTVRRLEVAMRTRATLKALAHAQDRRVMMQEAEAIVGRQWRAVGGAQGLSRKGKVQQALKAARQAERLAEAVLSRAVSENLRLDEAIRAQHLSVEADVKLDFGHSPAADGWQAVTTKTRWEDGKAPFGWVGEPVLATAGSPEGEPDPLHSDSISSASPAEFCMKLDDGRWEVVVISPGSRAATTAVEANGRLVLTGATGFPGTWLLRRFAVEVKGGALRLRFSGAPVGPCFRTNTSWAVTGLALRHIPDRKPSAEALTGEWLALSSIRQWQVLGYDDDESCSRLSQLAVAYSAPQHQFNPPQLYRAAPAGVAVVDLASVFHAPGRRIARLCTYVRVDKPVRAKLHFGASGRALVWLTPAGGKRQLIVRDLKAHGLDLNEYVVALGLKAGWNRIEAAASCCWGDMWQMAAALTELDGRPLDGSISAATPGTKLGEPLVLPHFEAQVPDEVELGTTAAARVRLRAAHLPTAPALLRVQVSPTGALSLKAKSFSVPALKPGQERKISIPLSFPAPAEAKSAVASFEVRARDEKHGIAREELIRLVQPTIELREARPGRRTVELARFSSEAHGWVLSCPEDSGTTGLDRQQFHSPPASLSVQMRDNANGKEDYPHVQLRIAPPGDWLDYDRLELWARCEGEPGTPDKRHLCVEVVGPDWKVRDFHYYLPLGRWQKVEVDLDGIPRYGIQALRLFVYEMHSKGWRYTWWFDDLQLVARGPLPELGPRERRLRALVHNPLSRGLAGRVSLAVPPGWHVRPADEVQVSAKPGQIAAPTFIVRWPATAEGKPHNLTATLSLPEGEIRAALQMQPLPALSAPHVPRGPRLDGRLDDACWQRAAWATGFVRNDTGAPASAETAAGVCWNERGLYIAFRCKEPDMAGLKATVTNRDGQAWLDDCVEVYIDADADRQPEDYDHYVVNVLGTLRDERNGNGRWNSRARAAAARGQGEWTAELVLSWEDYGGVPQGPWAINLHRTRHPKRGLPQPEYQCWSCTRGPFDNPTAFGTLRFVRSG